MERHKLTAPKDIERFITGGNAYFTVVNPVADTRYTFRVSQKENDDGSKSPFFVSVLTGPDNWSNNRYVGILTNRGQFSHGKKAKIGNDAPSVKCITWLLKHLRSQSHMDKIEFWHEGRCGMCGRKLTVPESIAVGIGPVCAGR